MVPKYSIITPFHIWSPKRRDDFYRCLRSVDRLIGDDFEHILVDDGSVEDYQIKERDWQVFYAEPHLERVLAYTEGMQLAKGQWFIFLDSDDEILPNALKIYEEAIRNNPDYKMFNFAMNFVSKSKDGKDWTRGPFDPKKRKVGHVKFGGGNIVNGSYIFHRSVYETLGGFPENCFNRAHTMHKGQNLSMTSPWDFSIRMQELFPEIKPLFQVVNPDHPQGYPRELGNPWGQDFALFYKYTRKYHSLPSQEATHAIHPR